MLPDKLDPLGLYQGLVKGTPSPTRANLIGTLAGLPRRMEAVAPDLPSYKGGPSKERSSLSKTEQRKRKKQSRKARSK